MSTEQSSPPYERCAAGDPLHPLVIEKVRRFLLDISGPITWEVGDTWVVFDNGGWRIGADELATEDQVRELMVTAGGIAKVREFQ